MSRTVLVMGGGVGGVVAANVLVKTLPEGNRVIVVDRNDSHNFRGAFPLMLVNRRRPRDISRKLDDLRRKGIDFIQAGIEHLDTGRQKVQTDLGTLEYDYAIISLGAEYHPETVPGMAEGSYNPWSFEGSSRLRRQLAGFRRGRIVFFISSLPISCPPAPYEVMFLLDAYFRHKGVREQVELTLVTPETAPEPLAGPKVGASISRMLNQRHIRLITGAKVLSLDTKSGSLVLDHGISVPGDLFLGVPSHWGPSALRDSGLAEEGGWIAVDPVTLETRDKRVFAVGDAAALKLPVSKIPAPKAGIFAHYQAEVVARNIATMVAGGEPHFRYPGRGL